MSPELDRLLVRKFPKLYRGKGYDIPNVYWGFECGDGWFEVIHNLSLELEKLIPNGDPAPRALQVREKYGAMEFRLYDPTDQMKMLVKSAEELTLTICETCGQSGSLRDRTYWKFVACDKHSEDFSSLTTELSSRRDQ